jgi:hypothetical protein
MYQASRFTKDRRLRDLAGELEMTREFLKLVQGMFKCPIYFKIGNHEARWEHYLQLKAPELLGIDDFKLEQILRFREFGVTLVKDKQIAMAGKTPNTSRSRMVWRICASSQSSKRVVFKS